MTNEQKYKNSTIEEFAQHLFDFFIGFHTESIKGLCDKKECSECTNSCIGCIVEWLNEEIE